MDRDCFPFVPSGLKAHSPAMTIIETNYSPSPRIKYGAGFTSLPQGERDEGKLFNYNRTVHRGMIATIVGIVPRLSESPGEGKPSTETSVERDKFVFIRNDPMRYGIPVGPGNRRALVYNEDGGGKGETIDVERIRCSINRHYGGARGYRSRLNRGIFLFVPTAVGPKGVTRNLRYQGRNYQRQKCYFFHYSPL